MSLRTFTVLALLTGFVIALAGFVVSREPGFVTTKGGEVVFPELTSHIDEVNKIVVRSYGRTMTMERGEQGWVLAESGGYPVQAKIIKSAILGFADLIYVEAKTRQKEKYSKLELQDPSVDNSKGRGVQIYAKTKDLLVDAVIGRTRFNMPGTTRDGIYVRTIGDPQSWLALGQLDVSSEPADWLMPGIVDIKSDRMKSVKLYHPDGEIIAVSKDVPSARSFALAGIPEDSRLKYDRDPDNIASVLDELELSDAVRADKFKFNTQNLIEATFETFDGLVLTVKMSSLTTPLTGKPEHWISLSAETPEGTLERKQEADKINAHVSSWVYKIPGYKASRLNKRLSEMVTRKQPNS